MVRFSQCDWFADDDVESPRLQYMLVLKTIT